MSHDDKPMVWLHGQVKSPPFSLQARLETGLLLRRLQRGDVITMPHSRPMPNIGKRCHELRVTDGSRQWRIVYFLDDDAVVILDVFEKKTRKMPLNLLRLSQARLKSYLNEGR